MLIIISFSQQELPSLRLRADDHRDCSLNSAQTCIYQDSKPFPVITDNKPNDFIVLSISNSYTFLSCRVRESLSSYWKRAHLKWVVSLLPCQHSMNFPAKLLTDTH